MASRLSHIRPNPSGISRTLKSAGVQQALDAVIAPIAARANTNFVIAAGDPVELGVKNGTRRTVRFNGVPKIPPYGSFVDLGTYTAIGKVVCMTELGRIDNARNNTILKSR